MQLPSLLVALRKHVLEQKVLLRAYEDFHGSLFSEITSRALSLPTSLSISQHFLPYGRKAYISPLLNLTMGHAPWYKKMSDTNQGDSIYWKNKTLPLLSHTVVSDTWLLRNCPERLSVRNIEGNCSIFHVDTIFMAKLCSSHWSVSVHGSSGVTQSSWRYEYYILIEN